MPSASNPQNSPAVLVVDADDKTREHRRAAFEKAGYRASGAPDTTSALRHLQLDPSDLVVIDLALPKADGLGLCKLLRARIATSKTPIIIISNDDAEGRKASAFEAGADDYIPQSSSAAEIISRSTAHLRAAEREWALIGSNRELRFLADLGRGLLRTLEPDQLVRRVAGATYEGTSAAMCAAVISTGDENQVACVFDREGSAEGRRFVASSSFAPMARFSIIECDSGAYQ